MQLHMPRSLTAPEAVIAVLIAIYFQYKQYSRLQRQKNQEKGASKTPLKASSLFHDFFFSGLRVMVSPSGMASNLNANVVDLHSKQDQSSDKKARKSKGGSRVATDKASSGVMEIRTRRIKHGELVLSKHFPALETTITFACAVLIGIVLRWIFGLVRSLRLSRNVDGVCCSSYQGLETDSKSSLERLLACVLIKSEGDEAGKLLLTVLIVLLFVHTYKLAKSMINPMHNGSLSGAKKTTDDKGRHIYRRVSKQKVKRFFAFIGAVLSALWLFHTPALLRYFGLFGLIQAAEELSARILLLGNLIGIVSIPENDPLYGYSTIVQTMTNSLLAIFALTWGIYASVLVECIQETARNAAFVLSQNASKTKNKKQSPDEVVALLNTRIMLIIQGIAPLVIIFTFFSERHFAEILTKSTRGGSWKSQYLQNSGQFVRVGLSWSFLGASIYTIRSLLQSYLDQASTVASALSMYGETRSKSNETDKIEPDSFSDRYAKILPTAGKIAAFPLFVFGIMALAHVRGGDISVHPGVDNEHIDALSVSAIKGLVPAYSGEYATWIANNNSVRQQEMSHSLLHAASMSQSTWEETPFRDSAHSKLSDWLGGNKYCSTPTVRAVKAMGRELYYMTLQINDITISKNATLPIAVNGQQLLQFANPVPYTFTDLLFQTNNLDMNADGYETCGSGQTDEVCMATITLQQRPRIGMLVSSILSHSIITPTIVIPIVETLSFLSSIWWTIWYTMMVILYWFNIRKAAGLHISA